MRLFFCSQLSVCYYKSLLLPDVHVRVFVFFQSPLLCFERNMLGAVCVYLEFLTCPLYLSCRASVFFLFWTKWFFCFPFPPLLPHSGSSVTVKCLFQCFHDCVLLLSWSCSSAAANHYICCNTLNILFPTTQCYLLFTGLNTYPAEASVNVSS